MCGGFSSLLQLELPELPVMQPVFLGSPPLLHHFPPLLSILVANVKTHINIVYKPAKKVYFITNVRAYIIKGLGPLHVVVTRYNPSYIRHQIYIINHNNGVCCEDELDDLFPRSFLSDIRGCRVYRQILASIYVSLPRY